MMLILFFLIFALIGVYFYFFFRRFFSLFPPIGKRKGLSRLLSAAGGAVCIAASLRVYDIGAVVVLHFLALGVVMDIVQLFLRHRIRDLHWQKCWERIYKSGVIPILLITLWMGYGYWNMHQIHRTEYRISTEKELERDLRIVQISDLHMGTTMDTQRLEEILEDISREEPDILALTGDIVDERTSREMMEETARLLGEVETAYGIYYVYGNHDYNTYVQEPAYTPAELTETLTRNGIQVLEDAEVSLECGVTVLGRKDSSVVRGDLSEIMTGEEKENFLLLLDHQPGHRAEGVEAGVDLQLSGHTHAGQIWPTGQLGQLFGTTELNYGLEQEGSYHRIVSSGIAGWGYAIRTGGHSEYVVIDVEKN